MATILADLMLRLRANSAELNKGVKGSKIAVDDLDKTVKRTSKTSSKNFKNMQKSATGAFSGIAGSMGAIAPAAQGALGGFRAMAVGATTLNAALGPIGIIIAAIALVVKALASYFKGSVDGAAKFAGIMGYLKGILMVVQDAFISLGRWIVWAFEHPKEAVADLWAAIKQNLVNRMEGLTEFFKASFELIKDGFSGVALAIKGLFDDEAKKKSQEFFAQMGDDLRNIGKAAVKMATGMDVEEIIKKGSAALAEMRRVAELNAQIEKELFQLRLDNLGVSRLESSTRKDMSKLLLISKDIEGATMNERKEALDELIKLEQKIADAKVSAAAKAVELQQRQMAISENSIEDQEKLVGLQNSLDAILIDRDNKMRELVNRQNELYTATKMYGEEYADQTQRQAEDAKKAADAKAKLEKQAADYKLSVGEDTAAKEIAIQQAKLDQGLMLIEEFELRKAEIEGKYRDKKAEEDKVAAEKAASEAATALEKVRSIQESGDPDALISGWGALFAKIREGAEANKEDLKSSVKYNIDLDKDFTEK